MIRKWLVLLMAFLLPAACACGEEVLRGYDAEAGYVYVTFGRYYQSIDGGIPDDGKQTWEWHQISMKEQKEAKKSGVPFDPLLKPDPDVTLPAEERQIGGLGIYMVKKSMDSMEYERRDGKNILTIRKTL